MDAAALVEGLKAAASDPALRAQLATLLGMLFEDTLAEAKRAAWKARGNVQSIDDALAEFMRTGEVKP